MLIAFLSVLRQSLADDPLQFQWQPRSLGGNRLRLLVGDPVENRLLALPHERQSAGGASAIECCYTASFTRLSSTLTKIVKWANTDLTFSHASKTILDEKISLNVSRHLVRPA